MGILNVTPDSFSDGGAIESVDHAIEVGLAMVGDGAAIVDVGGESTRPYASPVPVDEELARTVPVVAGLAREGAVVSIDTSKPEVARACLAAGAAIVNDVTGLADSAMRAVCADTGCGVVIMHMQGTPATMQDDPRYDDVVEDVARFLDERAREAVASGVSPASIVVDPGIGFGKFLAHNLDLIRSVGRLTRIGFPVLIGTSRKGFLGTILEPIRGHTEAAERDGATAATVAAAVLAGAAIVRVHDVRLGVDVATTAKAMVPER